MKIGEYKGLLVSFGNKTGVRYLQHVQLARIRTFLGGHGERICDYFSSC